MTHALREENGPPESAPLEAILAEAGTLGEEGRWVEAMEVLRSAEADYPEDPTLLCMLGVVSGEAGAPGMAYDYFRRSAAAGPQDPGVLITLGTELSRYDDPDAEALLRLAVVTAPELAAVHLAYGGYLAREGLVEQAVAELSRADELEPGDPATVRELATARLIAGNVAAGIAELERASSLAEADPEIHLLLGLALVADGRLEDAADELLRAAPELADDAEAQAGAALAAAAVGWPDPAWDALARAEVAAQPADPELLAEIETVIEEPELAQRMLVDEVGPALLHARLLERP